MEVTFACKRFPIDQVLRCSFNLSISEFKVLKLLLKKGQSSADDLAQLLMRDRTTVQRALKSLLKKGLVERRQLNLDFGGYQYLYSAADKQLIKSKVQKQFETFSNMVHKEIEDW